MLKKIQGRIRSVMGLLSKIWPTVDIASLDEEDAIDTDLEEIKYFVGQALYFYDKWQILFSIIEDIICCCL